MNRLFKKVVSPILTTIFLFTTIFSGVFSVYADTTETTYFYLHDHLGSVDAVLDDEGNVVERRDYLPFGEERLEVIEETEHPELYESETYGYTDKELDDETGLMYYGARYYDPTIGRFISFDPLLLNEGSKPFSSVLENPQALNPYSYVLNNPIRMIDETGEYGSDFHYDLTYFLGMQAGLGFSDSFEIAFYNQYTDENPETSPYPDIASGKDDVKIRELYHFPSNERVNEVLTNAFETMSNEDFGTALHVHDDSFAHAGFGPKIGHVLKLWTPDWTWWNDINKAKAKTAAFSKFALLREFNKQKYGTGDLSAKDYDSQTKTIWEGIEGKINNFINAKTMESKLEALYPELYGEDKEEKEEGK